jgi:ParB family chromosome partitioning protein
MTTENETPQHGAELQHIAPDDILVPELRITSQIDPHLMEEMLASVKREGILTPLNVTPRDGKYILIDGLHRLYVAKELGLKTVPCMVQVATDGEIMTRNLITNRHRGKSNPAQEAKVIRYLAQEEQKGIEEIVDATGLSDTWVRKLLAVAFLPTEVEHFIEDGYLSVTNAFHLTKLVDPEWQIQTARDAVKWNYNEQQIRDRVADLNEVRPELKPGDTTFTEKGQPIRIPLTCHFCLNELEGKNYLWVCPECEKLLTEFWKMYQSGNQAVRSSEPVAALPQRLKLVDGKWLPQ